MSFAGASVVADGRLLRASSVNAAAASSGYHLLAVEGYTRTKDMTPNGHCISSRPFFLGGHRWLLECFPNGRDPGSAEFISVRVVLDDDDTSDDDTRQPVKVKAQVAFSFIDQAEWRAPARVSRSDVLHLSRVSCAGQARFVKRAVLERSRHLNDDSFVIRCDIVVVVDTGKAALTSTKVPMPAPPPSDMQSLFSDLHLNKEGADVTFEVGGEKFAAHRFILAARSAVFKAELSGDMNMTLPGHCRRQGVVRIDDMDAKVFRGLLTYIYTDSLPLMDEGDEAGEDQNEENESEEDEEAEGEVSIEYVMWLLQLLEAADRYELERLRLICEEFLASHVHLGSVVDIIVVAERRGCRWLKEACLEFIKSHTSLHTLFLADGFEQVIRTCTPSGLKELIFKFSS